MTTAAERLAQLASLIAQDGTLPTSVAPGTGGAPAPAPAHPDLAEHDALGLATDTELVAHANAASHTNARTPLPHAHLDADIPAAIARDAEVAAAYSPLGHTHPGGAVDVKEAEIDFGLVPRRSGRFVVIDAAVTPSTQLLAYHSGTAATGRQADENEMDALAVRAVAGSGQFIAYVDCANRVSGKFRLAYLIG